MKICILSNDFSFEPLGGRNVTMERIMNGIVEKDAKTEFHVITKKGKKRFEKRGNVHSYRLDKFEKNARKLIEKLEKSIHFDLIHGFDIYPDGYLAVTVSSSLKKPCLVGLRGVYILKAGDMILNYVARKADYVVAVDKKSMKLFKKITGRKNKTLSIRNSIQPFKVDKAGKEKEFIIGNVTYLGDVRKTKGWNYLLDAFKKFRDEVPDSKLVLIGASDTSKKSEIRKIVVDKGLGKSVILKGVFENPGRNGEIRCLCVTVHFRWHAKHYT
jgi:glycosyltransferase involved in cell wall biosynthesis